MDTDRQASRTSRRRRPRRSRAPLWLVETVDTVRLRSRLLLATAGGVVVVGTLASLLAPTVIPPVPIVGAALGFAAVLLGLAVAIAVDAADLRVRGPRHVRAAGGELVAILPPDADPATAAPLAAAALDARDDDAKLLLGLAAVGDDAATAADLTDSLAVALATHGVSVLRMDLARGASDAPGVFEVADEQLRLARAASFEPDVKLAWLPAGSSVAGALAAIPSMIASLPRDLDVLVVALPAATSRQVVRSAASLDHVLLVAERGVTSRVELIAALDAFDAAGCPAQVVLLDGRSARWLGIGAVGTADVAPPPEADRFADDVVPTDEASDAASLPTAVDAAADAAAAAQRAEQPSHAPVGPRDVTVVLGAAQAAALADADRPASPRSHPDEHRASDVTTAELPVAPPVPADPAAPGPTVDVADDAGQPPESPVDGDDPADALLTTDELTPVVVDDDASQDDPLLTTAQLSALIDEVESRDDRR